MTILDSDRLCLRPFTSDDTNNLLRLAADWRIADKIPVIPHPYNEQDAKSFIEYLRGAEESEKEIGFAITRKSDGEFLGSISILLNKAHFRGTLGYWIGVEYWGHGYATEACKAVLEYGFNTLNLNRIQATAYTRNAESRRVLEKSGFKYEGTSPQSIYARGNFEDVANYGFIKSDYGND